MKRVGAICSFTHTHTHTRSFVFLRENTDAAQEVEIKFIDEIFRIDTRDGSGQNGLSEEGEGEERKNKPDCDWCKDNPRRKCKHCACSVCGGKDSPDKQILCDECDCAYHLWCLSPPLQTVPEVDEWYVRCMQVVSQLVKGFREPLVGGGGRIVADEMATEQTSTL